MSGWVGCQSGQVSDPIFTRLMLVDHRNTFVSKSFNTHTRPNRPKVVDHVRVESMSGWIGCQGESNVRVDRMSGWIGCQGGVHVRVKYMSGWSTCQGRSDVRVEYMSGWSTCQGVDRMSGWSTCPHRHSGLVRSLVNHWSVLHPPPWSSLSLSLRIP